MNNEKQIEFYKNCEKIINYIVPKERIKFQEDNEINKHILNKKCFNKLKRDIFNLDINKKYIIYENLMFKREDYEYKFNINKLKLIDRLKLYIIPNTLNLLCVNVKEEFNKKYENILYFPIKFQKDMINIKSGSLTMNNIYHLMFLMKMCPYNEYIRKNNIDEREFLKGHYYYIISRINILYKIFIKVVYHAK
jgi:hypothetical protein